MKIQPIVVQLPVAASQEVTTNHLMIFDRSGSMYGSLTRLIDDVILRISEIPEGDTLSVGWFSSEGGEYNWIFKGLTKTALSEKRVADLLRKNSTTIGLTCFSEIFGSLKQVMTDLSLLGGDKFSLCFFTDGHPVVSNYAREKQNLFAAIDAVKGEIVQAIVVGYGSYYNKELLSQVATALGGCLTHSKDVKSFGETYSNFIASKVIDARVSVSVPGSGVVFSFDTKGNVLTYDRSVDGTVKTNAPILYVIEDGDPGITLLDVSAYYAGAYVMSQRTRVGEALELLSVIGDVACIDAVVNAFTNSEYAEAEALLRDCINNPESRYSRGRDTSYLPKEDAFCLVDLFDLLAEDEAAYFYPRHPDFKYEAISLPSVKDPMTPVLTIDPDTRCRVSDVWNETRLNFSMRATMLGKVTFRDDGHTALGFASTYPVKVYRNYTFICDGVLNVKALPVILSEATFNALVNQGMLKGTFDAGKIYTLDLTRIPVMNRSMAKNLSATSMAQDWVDTLKLKARAKVFNDLFASSKDEEVSYRGMNEAQTAYLKSHFINEKGEFSPPTTKGGATDYYEALKFELKVSGWSKLPTVASVKAKVANKAKLSESETEMSAALSEYENAVGSLDKGVQAAWLEGKSKKIKAEINNLRKKVQRNKFGILLGKKWFTEFTSREDCSIKISDTTVTFNLSTERVAY